MNRDVGGLVHVDGQLDTEKAALGYEVYLTMSALGYGSENLSLYATELEKAGVPLEPIHEKAGLRLDRITDKRRALTGSGWEG